MTDPRIEAAFEAAWNVPCLLGDPIACHNLDDVCIYETQQENIAAMKAVIRKLVTAALAAADAASPVRVVPMPIPADRMETAKNTLLCWKSGALTDEDVISMIVCGVSGPQSPETITIPEVRNDRPIPGKGGVDG